MIFQKRFSDFKNYFLLNKSSALVIFIIYSVVNINIGLAEYPYIDDIGRQLQGYSKFSEHYSRYLSEYSARLIQGQSFFCLHISSQSSVNCKSSCNYIITYF